MIAPRYKVEVYMFRDDFASNGLLLSNHLCYTHTETEQMLSMIDTLSNQLSFRYEFTVEKAFEEVSKDA